MKPDKVELFKVSAGRTQFYVRVTTRFDFRTDAPLHHSLNVGGKMKGCVEILVNVPSLELLDERFAQMEATKCIADISHIGYNPMCSVSEDLPSGVGTQLMVRTAMAFVCKHYDWVTHFSLIDNSHVQCKEGLDISLACLSLVTNGSTYYEKYFHAVLANAEDRARYDANVAKLSDPTEKLPFESFVAGFQVPDAVAEYMRPVYLAAPTYLEFFRQLKARCEADGLTFCAQIHPWVQVFVDFILQNQLNYNLWMRRWSIDARHIQRIHVGEESVDLDEHRQATDILQAEFERHRVQLGGRRSYLGPDDR